MKNGIVKKNFFKTMYKTEGTKVVVQLRKTLAKSNLGEHAHYSDIHNRDTEHK